MRQQKHDHDVILKAEFEIAGRYIVIETLYLKLLNMLTQAQAPVGQMDRRDLECMVCRRIHQCLIQSRDYLEFQSTLCQ